MVDGPLPVCMGDGSALIVRDRYQRHLAVFLEELPQVRRVHHSVHRGQGRDLMSAHQRKMDVIAVKVNDVELAHVAKHEFQQSNMVGKHFAHLGIAPESPGTGFHELRTRLRVSARKQGHFMAKPYEYLGKIRDDTFAAAVKRGWHGFIQWRNLSDSHKRAVHNLE